MRPFTQIRSFLRPFIPAILVSAALLIFSRALHAQPPSADDAAPSSSQAIAQDPPITPEDIGDSLLVKRRYHEALDQYKKMSRSSPALWNKMGIAYQMLSDLKDAAHCYKQALRLNPAHAWALNNMGTIYDAQGDFARAEGFYRKAFDADSDSARIAMNLGTNLMTQKKYTQGQDMYKRALALDPEVFEQDEGPVAQSGVPIEQRGAMSYYKARDYAQAGMIDRALKFLRKAINQGYASASDVAQDSSFAALRQNPAFQRLIAEHSQSPSRQSPSGDSAGEPQASND